MGVYNVDEVSVEDISRLMVGRDVVSKIDKAPKHPGAPVLEVKNLSYGYAQEKMMLKNVNFSARGGEILGIAG